MAKAKTVYICQNCGNQVARWMGQCNECDEWNTFAESVVAPSSKSSSFGGSSARPSGKTAYLSTISSKKIERISSGISEFDRVLGGGFVPGQVILLAGSPGIGKSTLLTQLSKSIKDHQKKNVAYVAGEESPQQIKLRAERLKYEPDNLLMVSEINLETVIATLEQNAQKENIGLIIIDSVQTLTSDNLTGIAGSVGQVRLSAQLLSNLAKNLGIPLILVGHVTKEGTVAGPKVLEHLVDTVFYLEGDSQHLYRLLKTTKNRFGAVSEVGMFEMQDSGLVEVLNPSEVFLSGKESNIPGSCVTVVMEGYRPLLFEIQALTTKTAFGYPRRTASGFNTNRLQVLLAILEKRARIDVSSHDVYVNVAGGFKVNEYASDIAVCLAIASSIKNQPLKVGIAAFGECGLLGELRRVSNMEARAKEAKKLGYSSIISPLSCKSLQDAIKQSF